MENYISYLEKLFNSTQSGDINRPEDLYQLTMSKVSIKKISKGPLINTTPFEAQRAGFKLSKEEKALPKKIKNTHVYYLDNENRVLLIEVYGQVNSAINRNFFSYTDVGIEKISFGSDGKLRNISLLKNQNGTIINVYNYGKYGFSSSDYQYSENLLKSILVTQKEHANNDTQSHVVCFEYDDSALVKITNKYHNGYEEQCYP